MKLQEYYVNVDYTRRIHRVKIFVADRFLQHLMLEDPAGKVLVNLEWYKHDKRGSWKGFEIPQNKEIIGMQCNTD